MLNGDVSFEIKNQHDTFFELNEGVTMIAKYQSIVTIRDFGKYRMVPFSVLMICPDRTEIVNVNKVLANSTVPPAGGSVSAAELQSGGEDNMM